MITIDPPSCVSAENVPGLRRVLGRFLGRVRESVGLQGGVDLLLTDDAEMMRLNREFRGKRKTTDVLSFPAARMPGLPEELQHAGDLAVSIPVAERQAREQGHTLAVELKVLILHGALHLAGMDHETDAGEMAGREAELRRLLRLPAGLIGRTEDEAGTRAAEGAARWVKVQAAGLKREKAETKRGAPKRVAGARKLTREERA